MPGIVLCIALLSTCASAAEPTRGERDAYAAGVVTGAYLGFISEIMDRLTSAGVPAEKQPEVIGNGCANLSERDVILLVLDTEPLPRSKAEAVLQTRAVMRKACAKLVATSS